MPYYFKNLRFWRELVIAIRFGLVGIAATTVHLIVVWLLLTKVGLNPFFANAMAFTIAFCISFFGNYIWTFRSSGSPRRAMFRFFIISVSAFLINTLILALLVQIAMVSPTVSSIISVSLVSVASFAASRFFGFRSHTEVAR